MTTRVPIWATVLLCPGVLALLTLLVGGPAIGAFACEVQYVLAFVGVLALLGGGSGRRRDAACARRELEVGFRTWERQKHAVVAIVIAKPTNHGQPEPVAVERDHLVELRRVPSHAHLEFRHGTESRPISLRSALGL
jgi:hypothetical protein